MLLFRLAYFFYLKGELLNCLTLIKLNVRYFESAREISFFLPTSLKIAADSYRTAAIFQVKKNRKKTNLAGTSNNGVTD